MSDDEDDREDQLLGEMLDSMRDMVQVYTSRLQDRIDGLEAACDHLEDELGRVIMARKRDADLVQDLRYLLSESETRRTPDGDLVARIRGLFHGRA